MATSSAGMPPDPASAVATDVTLTIKLLNNNSHQVSVPSSIGVRDLKARVKVSRLCNDTETTHWKNVPIVSGLRGQG